MIRISFKWENEEYLDSKYGHKCLHGGGSSDADQDGAENGGGNQGGGNPADRNNPGVSTGLEGSSGAVDTGFDIDNWGGHGIQGIGHRTGATTNQQFGGTHPDQDPANNPGIGYGIQGVDIDVDVDYGAYDNPAYDSTQQMAHSVFDPGISLSTQQMDTRTFHHNWDNPDTQFSPMESTQLGQNTAVKNAANAAMSRALGMDEAEARARNSTALGTMEQDAAINLSAPAATNQDTFDADLANTTGATVGYVDPETTTLEAITQQEHEQKQKEIEDTAPPTSVTGTPSKRAYRGTPAITTGPTVSPTVDAVLEAKTKQMRAISVVQGWRDLFDKSKKAWGPFKNFTPAYNKRTKTAIVKDLYEKYGPTLQEVTKEYSKQVNKDLDEEGVGFRGLLPGYSAIRGLMGLIGLEEEHTHPAHQALLDMMEDAGLIDKDYGEGQTEAAKRIACESKGYKWDSDLQACIKSGSDI